MVTLALIIPPFMAAYLVAAFGAPDSCGDVAVHARSVPLNAATEAVAGILRASMSCFTSKRMSSSLLPAIRAALMAATSLAGQAAARGPVFTGSGKRP